MDPNHGAFSNVYPWSLPVLQLRSVNIKKTVPFRYSYLCYAIFQIKAAQKVTVVGGGAAGVEFAGEIKSDYPEKTVSLVHSHDQLIEYPGVTQAFRDNVRSILDRIKVAFILGQCKPHWTLWGYIEYKYKLLVGGAGLMRENT